MLAFPVFDRHRFEGYSALFARHSGGIKDQARMELEKVQILLGLALDSYACMTVPSDTLMAFAVAAKLVRSKRCQSYDWLNAGKALALL